MPEPALKKVAVRQVGGKDGFQITIFSNIEAQKKNLLKFTAIGVERATYRALNKTGGKANTVLKRDISKSYNLAQKEFAANLKQIKGGHKQSIFRRIQANDAKYCVSHLRQVMAATVSDANDGNDGLLNRYQGTIKPLLFDTLFLFLFYIQKVAPPEIASCAIECVIWSMLPTLTAQ